MHAKKVLLGMQYLQQISYFCFCPFSTHYIFFLVTFVAVLWSIGLVVLDDHKRTECAKNENHYTKSHSYDMM